MKDLIEKLQKSGEVVTGGRVNVYHNIDARKYLQTEGMAVLPDEYFSMVKYANGLKSDKAEIYAVMPLGDNRNFRDVIRMNEALDRDDYETVCVLGETDFDYLIYDCQIQQYQLRDKAKDAAVASFDTILQPIEYMFL